MRQMDIALYMIGNCNLVELHNQKTQFIYKLISQYNRWEAKEESDWDIDKPLYNFKSKDWIVSGYAEVIQIEVEKLSQFTKWLIRYYPSNQYTQWFKLSSDEFEQTLESILRRV